MGNATRALALAAILSGLASAPSAAAMDRALRESLSTLDPETRFVQVCDLAAMDSLAKDKSHFLPEHAMVDYLGRPSQKGDTLEGKGAVFRSRGDWYRFTFSCTTSDDHYEVTSFRYKLGDKIPREEWDELNLFP